MRTLTRHALVRVRVSGEGRVRVWVRCGVGVGRGSLHVDQAGLGWGEGEGRVRVWVRRGVGVGSWEGKPSSGGQARVSFYLAAGGKVLGHSGHECLDAPLIVCEVTAEQPLVPGEGEGWGWA